MKIKNKLFSAFALVICLIVAIGINNAVILKKAKKNNISYNEVFLLSIIAGAKIRVNVDATVRYVEEYAAGWEEEVEVKDAIAMHITQIKKNNEVLTAIQQGVFNEQTLNDLNFCSRQFIELTSKTFNAYRNNDEQKVLVMKEFDNETEKLQELLNEMQKDVIKELDISTKEINNDIVNSSSLNLIAIFLIILIAVMITIITARSISMPIQQLKHIAKSVGEGELNTLVDIKTNDEIEELADSFNKMVFNLKNSREELMSMQSKLMQAGKMASIGELAGGVAHEINNPLTGILNNVQLIKLLAAEKKDFKLAEFNEILQIVEESALRCTKITQSLLEFARTSKGDYKAICLNVEIGKVLGLIKHELFLQNITVQEELYPELPNISGDTQLIQQVFFDLISNAKWAIKKKSGSIGGTITIKTAYILENKTVCMEFLDTGIGISKHNLEKIFDPFFTTKTVGEGTGLGLAIIYSIIKAHKASINVTSVENRGTAFKIIFPAL